MRWTAPLPASVPTPPCWQCPTAVRPFPACGKDRPQPRAEKAKRRSTPFHMRKSARRLDSPPYTEKAELKVALRTSTPSSPALRRGRERRSAAVSAFLHAAGYEKPPAQRCHRMVPTTIADRAFVPARETKTQAPLGSREEPSGALLRFSPQHAPRLASGALATPASSSAHSSMSGAALAPASSAASAPPSGASPAPESSSSWSMR